MIYKCGCMRAPIELDIQPPKPEAKAGAASVVQLRLPFDGNKAARSDVAAAMDCLRRRRLVV